ncbi:unnamed protein product [Symbiodinium sp. CCMP2592]|nr:unnamed protein product [Symbiodinium sp. CCMP2592]
MEILPQNVRTPFDRAEHIPQLGWSTRGLHVLKGGFTEGKRASQAQQGGFGRASACLAVVSCAAARARCRVARFSSHACNFAGGRSEGRDSKSSPERLSDLFLQLSLPDAVLLSGVLARDQSKVRMLPPPASSMPRLAIVPVVDSKEASCVPFHDRDEESLETLRRFSPGPLQPLTAPGKALKWFWQRAPQDFESFCKYEHVRAACGGTQSLEEQAEILLFNVYQRFCQQTSAPPRPSSSDETDYDLYISVFQDAPMKALHQTCSADFCMIAEAHVLGLASGTAGFPRLSQKDARSMYSSAMRFGYAVRQAEIRFQVDGAAGTFVPLPLEAEMVREELEYLWTKPAVQGERGSSSGSSCEDQLSDAEAAQRSLQEVFGRLKRIGETKPALATYLGWLGKFDPEALSMLSNPMPAIAIAMKHQADAVWGGAAQEEANDLTVTTTPSDMLEAILLGAWLHDCDADVREARSRLQAREAREQGS